MLIEFSFSNFGPYKDRNSFSMVASNYDRKTNEVRNVVTVEKFNLRLLRCAGVYGANASGKSRLLKAMMQMRTLVLTSANNQDTREKINIKRFLLDEDSSNEPCTYEITFYQNDKIYNYGFEFNENEIVKEWLYLWSGSRRTKLFERDVEGCNTNETHFKVGKTIIKEKMAGRRALVLSTAFQFKSEENNHILDIRDWFTNFKMVSGMKPELFRDFSYSRLLDADTKQEFIDFLKDADFCIEDISSEVEGPGPEWLSEIDEIIKKHTGAEVMKKETINIQTSHKKYNKNGEVGTVNFSLETQESEGTKKYLELAGPIIDIMRKGGTLVVDELEASLHPLLVEKIIELFNTPEKNKRNAQLIFATHNIITMQLLRRDQIWFVSKNARGVSTLLPLSDFKNGPRREEDVKERYMAGRYGGIPSLGRFGSRLRVEEMEKIK